MSKIKFHTLDSLRTTNFRFIIIIIICFGGIDWSYNIFIGWLAYDLSNSDFLTSITIGVAGVPFLLIGPFIGILSDTFDRRKLILVTLATMIVITVVTAAVVFNYEVSIWHLFILSFLVGTGGLLIHISIRPIIFDVVPNQYLLNAFSLESMSYHVARLFAPTIAGVLIAWFGPIAPLSLPFIFYCIAFASAYSLTIKPRAHAKEHAGATTKILDGLRYVTTSRTIVPLMLMGSIPFFLILPSLNALMPVFAKEVFNTNSVGLGLLSSSLGFGATFGAILIASVGNIKNKGKIVCYAVATYITFSFLFATNSTFGLSLILLGIASAANSILFSTNSTLIQTATIDKFRGRVSSISSIPIGFFAVGTICTGILSELFGPQGATMVASGTSAILLVLVLSFYPNIWRLE